MQDSPEAPRRAVRTVRLRRLGGGGRMQVADTVAVEEPLAIRLASTSGDERQLAVTMRTPGNDHELAVGWLFAEGVISSRAQVLDVSWCVRDEQQHRNAITVTLNSPDLPDLEGLDRHGVISSACGVCGTASLKALQDSGVGVVRDDTTVPREVLHVLPELLRDQQPAFAHTGGIHAAGRVHAGTGELIDLREDVGRHNALDKLVGSALLDGQLPLAGQVVVLSGRASYELLAKTSAAGAPVVAAIGAPSSLAVEVADEFGVTLVGFLRQDRANVYTHAGRIVEEPRSRTGTA